MGYDGIAIARSRESNSIDLTLKQIFLALAREIPTPGGKLVANPNVTWAVDLILVAKKLERVADHATNIAEDVILIIEAQNIKHAAKFDAVG